MLLKRGQDHGHNRHVELRPLRSDVHGSLFWHVDKEMILKGARVSLLLILTVTMSLCFIVYLRGVPVRLIVGTAAGTLAFMFLVVIVAAVSYGIRD